MVLLVRALIPPVLWCWVSWLMCHVCGARCVLDAVGPPLADAKSVVAVMDVWGDNEAPKFVFTVKLFMETLKASSHAKAQYMFFIQAVYSVICGIYPVTVDDAVQLAALQVLQKFGPHKPDVCVGGGSDVLVCVCVCVCVCVLCHQLRSLRANAVARLFISCCSATRWAFLRTSSLPISRAPCCL